MEEIDLTQSRLQLDQKNQFIDDSFKYEICPHCQRNFFIGKLKYHLKLCKPTNPMTKSPLKKTKRAYLSTALEKSQAEIDNIKIQSPNQIKSPEKYQKCPFCMATFSLTMMQKHSQKCSLKPHHTANPQDLNKLKYKTKIQFDFKKNLKDPTSALPRIRNSAKQKKNIERRQFKSEYTVKIREELSCFKKALEVQQIECEFCHRRFSKQASLRHIPICEKIKLQQMHQAALKKHSKSEVYKLGAPIKKSNLFRSKYLNNIGEKATDFQIKSTRVYDSQRISNASQIVKRSQRQQKHKQFKPILSKQKKFIQIENKAAQIKSEKKYVEPPSITDQMGLTFSKNLNELMIVQKENQLNNFTQIKQQLISMTTNQQEKKTLRNHQKLQKKITEEVENEFLQVTSSKKNFFSTITLESAQTVLSKETNLPTLDTKQKKLQVELENFEKNKISQNKAQTDYEQDFQD